MELRPWGDRKPSTKPNISHGSEAAEVAAIVAPVEGDMLIPKHRWSSFFQTHLELQLRCRGIKTIVIAGGSSDVGIVSTVFAARDLDFGIVVVRDCCYSHRDGNCPLSE
jgi:ureidoacrylate peracid hydrolase